MRQVDNISSLIELYKDNYKEHEVETICDGKIYAKKSNSDHLLGLNYLVL